MTDHDTPVSEPAPDAAGNEHADEAVIVDWSIIGRRLRLSALTLLAVAVLGWILGGLLHDGIRFRDLWGYVGLAFAGMFIAELVFVGGSALRGMLRAGERGERLAGGDVGILPPQVSGRRRRDGDP